MTRKKPPGLDNLLALNGDRYFIDEAGRLEVLFKVTRVAISPQRPHGIKYSLVLLNAKGERVVGFDNAHSAAEGSGPARKRRQQHDHKHIGDKISSYAFKDAHALLRDFWAEVEKHM